jgi:hypothetical protein
METLRLRKSEPETGKIKQDRKTDSVEVFNTVKQPLLLKLKTQDVESESVAKSGGTSIREKEKIFLYQEIHA